VQSPHDLKYVLPCVIDLEDEFESQSQQLMTFGCKFRLGTEGDNARDELLRIVYDSVNALIVF
jgi:hypothetical protein